MYRTSCAHCAHRNSQQRARRNSHRLCPILFRPPAVNAPSLARPDHGLCAQAGPDRRVQEGTRQRRFVPPLAPAWRLHDQRSRIEASAKKSHRTGRENDHRQFLQHLHVASCGPYTDQACVRTVHSRPLAAVAQQTLHSGQSCSPYRPALAPSTLAPHAVVGEPGTGNSGNLGVEQ